jgi:hypothetical protein
MRNPLSTLLGLTLVSCAPGGSVVDRTGPAGTFDVDLGYRPGSLTASAAGPELPAPAARHQRGPGAPRGIPSVTGP